MTIPIRNARAHDVPAVVELINRAYRVEEFFAQGDRTSRDEVAALRSRGVFLVADSHEKLDGCVHVETENDRGAFGLLSVDPTSQGNGLGRHLVEAAEEHCRRAGCRTIELRVVNLRSELPSWYRWLGYRECGSEPFPDTGRALVPCHFVIMSKEL